MIMVTMISKIYVLYLQINKRQVLVAMFSTTESPVTPGEGGSEAYYNLPKVHPQTRGGGGVIVLLTEAVRSVHYPVHNSLTRLVVAMRQGFNSIRTNVPLVVEGGQADLVDVVRVQLVFIRANRVH